MSRHWATVALMAFTGLFALGAFLQPFTFGLGYFGSVDGFGLHKAVGYGVLNSLTALILVAALISPTRRRDAPWALGLLVLVTVQIFLVGARDSAAWVAALHPLLGVTALLMAAWMHWLSRQPVAAA